MTPASQAESKPAAAHPRVEFLLEVLRYLRASEPPLWWWCCLAIAVELELREPEDLVAFDPVMTDYAIRAVRRHRRARQ